MKPSGRGEASSVPSGVARLTRWLLGVFFRRIEVVGASEIPAAGPLVFVANHHNGLIDPLLVLGCLPGRPRFLAKTTLWRIPLLRPFLSLGRVIPVHRRQDPGFSAEKNEESFARCRKVLAEGGRLALFPEGRSHNEPGLAALRTGAARILLGAEREHGPLGIRVVPVGLLYEAKSRFRSCVLVKAGKPLAVEPGSPDDSEAVRSLTERIADALREVTLSYPSWEEARLIERAVDLWLRQGGELSGRSRLAERAEAARTLVAAYRDLREELPEQLGALARALDGYDRALAALGLRDDQLAARYPLPMAGRFLGAVVPRLAVGLPAAAVGVLLNALPFRLCALAAARVARHPDQPATYKFFGGLVLYPLTWLVEGGLAGWWAGWGWGVGVGALGPLTGYAAMRFRDRWRVLVTETRAYFAVRKKAASELRRRRQAIGDELERLIEAYVSQQRARGGEGSGAG